MVNTSIVTEKLLLALLIGEMSTDLIAVFLGLKERDEVDASPHLFTGEFAVGESD